MAADFDSEMGSKNKRKSEVKKKQHTALRSNVQSYIYHIHGSFLCFPLRHMLNLCSMILNSFQCLFVELLFEELFEELAKNQINVNCSKKNFYMSSNIRKSGIVDVEDHLYNLHSDLNTSVQ